MLEQGISPDHVAVEREWVIPTAQGQSWSLGRLAAIFDALPDRTGPEISDEASTAPTLTTSEPDPETELREKLSLLGKKRLENGWGGKRALLAMANRGMGGDGTIVYYVVLEGTVKPRQN